MSNFSLFVCFGFGFLVERCFAFATGNQFLFACHVFNDLLMIFICPANHPQPGDGRHFLVSGNSYTLSINFLLGFLYND